MVLRRPYAFLIKHFRLIHLVILAILVYLGLKCRSIYSYLNSVIITSTNRYDAPQYISYWMILLIFLSIALMAIIYLLLKYKDKPRKMYIASIVVYAVLGVFLFLLFAYIGEFTRNLVDTKTIRFYRDILLIIMLFQAVIILLMAVRAFGFDIKKFDFNRDAQELNATSSDSEEVEINTKIDTTNIVRSFNKGQREFGYYLKEFKGYVIVILMVLLIIIGYKTYNFFTTTFKSYGEGDVIGENKIIKIVDSYYDSSTNKNYVIISFNIYKFGKPDRFTVENMVLHIGRDKYTPNKNICSKYSKLGVCYKKQLITNNEVNYILTYEVDNLNVKKAYIMYTDSYDENYKVKLNLKSA